MIRNVHQKGLLVLVAALCGSAWLTGCSGQPGDASETSTEQSGSVGLALQLASGFTLSQVNYAIVGPNAFSKSGVIDVSNSITVSAVIAGLPAGNGYSITLSGTTADGNTTCAGAASFNIVAHQTTVASLSLSCHQAATTGS